MADAAVREHDLNTCKKCGKKVEVQIYKNTGFCSQVCTDAVLGKK